MASHLSWYEIALKMRLPEMIEQNQHPTIVENMTHALLQESSLRARQPVEVLATGLAETSKMRTLPLLESQASKHEEMEKTKSFEQKPESSRLHSSVSLPRARSKPQRQESSLDKKSIFRRFENAALEKFGGKPRASTENWIPEMTRFRSIHRDLSVIKENLEDAMIRENAEARETRRFTQTELQRAHCEESLGSKHKSPCGSCLQQYSYVNLPMSVSYKAVIDIRKKWSNGRGGWWEALDEKLSSVPRCYDPVRICRFCSQFFQDQEKYRPSYDNVKLEERRTAHLETKQREKEYWDPLKMCEKDREAAEEMQNNAFLTMEGSASISTIDCD